MTSLVHPDIISSSVVRGQISPMMQVNDNTCAATLHIQIRPTFFGWLAQFGNRMRVLSPDRVVMRYNDYVKAILK